MNKALVLFSGGQDSTTCLMWALEKFDEVYTVGFKYGQKHSIEMECRQNILQSIENLKPNWKHKLKFDHVFNLDFLSNANTTSLTHNVEINHHDKYPNTFVPGRNLIFLNVASTIAYRYDIEHLITGVCETDFSGYPDCRDNTIKSLQVALNLGLDKKIVIHTPLMWINKSETWELAYYLAGQQGVDYIIQETHTCYKGDRSTLYTWGYGCNQCPACELRKKGYLEFLSI
ncbi:7-cyano-7-deazaguanine synthase QueC [Acinetobacter baumannii]